MLSKNIKKAIKLFLMFFNVFVIGIAAKIPQNNIGIKYNCTPDAPNNIIFIGSETNLLKDSLFPISQPINLANK